MVGGNGAWVVFEPDDVDLTAADLMVRPMVAGLDEGESEVLTRLAEPDFDAVVIVDKSGGPVGIITEHDGVRMAADQLGALPKVGEVAHAQWVSAQPKEALRNALGRLVAQRARHLLVEDEGGLKGVVSLRDLIGDDKEAPVRSVMREHVITVAPDVSVADAARLMLRERIGVLPVVGSEGVIGVVNRPLLIKLLL
jgi:CBS domain-containing protein